MDSKERKHIFQNDRRQHLDIFDIPHYKVIQKYLQFLGQDPNQKDEIRNIIVIAIVISVSGVLVPTSLELYVSLSNNNVDAAIDCLPNITAALSSLIKLLSVYFNRRNFKKLFDIVTKEWEQLKLNNELYVLEEITLRGSKIAQLYRNTLLYSMVLFLSIPLLFPVMNAVLSLNETHSREQLFKVNYIVFDHNDYYFYVYFQLAWGVFLIVFIIVTVDSLCILIIHHSSGMFAMCGYQIQQATKNTNFDGSESMSDSRMYEQYRNCVITHNKAVQFYNIVNESNRINYLLQVGLNITGISVTAFQTVINLDRPEEAIRAAAFFVAEQFHLFVLSLPGQVLLDHCAELTNNIYCSMWYALPIKIQKVLYTMQIRSKRLCVLTAGGLYDINMENFAATFKTCMSYFTILLSLKE